MTFEEYLKTVFTTDEKNWRLGQTYFNVLMERKSILANFIRGSVDDPYYNDSRIPSFLTFVQRYWDKPY